VTVPTPAITVRRVSKRYAVYRRQTDRIVEWVTRRQRHLSFWALRDVSFKVGSGEIVGVVGRNGAGKTTLLRLLAGISPPTGGEIDVNHRLSAILDLGSGFHPELSGRDNVFAGGAVLGMSDDELRRRYPEIVAFAELGAYMDMPFKTYSLGMQARLSFALAISVDPEILIIDEALAAGDSAFIAKCFERIRQICDSGATVLFVSHNTYLVQRLCRRALWIEGGQLAGDGDPARICRDYESALRRADQNEARAFLDERRFSAAASPLSPASANATTSFSASQSHVWGSGDLQILGLDVLGPDGAPHHVYYAGDPLTLRLHYAGDAPYDDLAVVILVTRSDGVAAAGLDAREAGLRIPPLRGTGSFEVTLDPLLLGRGRYALSPHVYRDRDGLGAPSDVLVYHDRLYELWVERHGRPYDVAVEQPARWRHLPGDAAPNDPGRVGTLAVNENALPPLEARE
jgi:lipopolysaccharide transport system ATP-binding protein